MVSTYAFRNRVQDLIDTGMPVNHAIAVAAAEDTQREREENK